MGVVKNHNSQLTAISHRTNSVDSTGKDFGITPLVTNLFWKINLNQSGCDMTKSTKDADRMVNEQAATQEAILAAPL